MSKMLQLTLNKQKEIAIDKIISALADCIPLETVQTIPVPALSSHKSRYLKPFGTWIAIAAIQALRAGFTTCGKR